MICTACGYKEIEEGEHRCPHCGRRLDRPKSDRFPEVTASSPPPPPPSGSGAQTAAAVVPEWKREVAGRFEQFQHKRARHRGPSEDSAEDDKSEAVPHPDPTQKVVAFEDFAADRIEPLIVEPPRPEPAPSRHQKLPPLAPAATPPSREAAAREADFQATVEPEAAPSEDVLPREILCRHSVAPLMLRGLAGALDLAVSIIAVGVFLGTFHLLGGAFHFNQKAGGAMALATCSLVAFYFFLYTFYGLETPGLQWMGLCVLDYDGNPPQPGQRLARGVGIVLSAAALGLGYLWALVDEEGLTWHDRMSKTFVTRDARAPQNFERSRA